MSQKAQSTQRPKKSTKPQQSGRGHRDGGPVLVEHRPHDRMVNEQAPTADGWERKHSAPATGQSAPSGGVVGGNEAITVAREYHRSRSPRRWRERAEANELGHLLRRTGSLVWCAKCGGHAGGRVGKLLKQKCHPVRQDEGGARPARLKRIPEGKHPVTGELLELRA